MRKAPVMDLLKALNDLLHVVASNVLLQAARLAEYDKQVCLVGREHKVGVDQVLELHFVRVEAFNHILVLHLVKHLLLVFCFIDLRVELFVQFYNNLLRRSLSFRCITENGTIKV
jgi:hypothetical protein